jgi:hypothetical protein
MPRKPKSAAANAPLAPVPTEALDQFVRDGPLSPEELDDAVRRFKKAIIRSLTPCGEALILGVYWV